LVHLTRKERVKKNCFPLVQHAAESCTVSKNLGDITKLLADIQRKWLEFYLEKLKSLKYYGMLWTLTFLFFLYLFFLILYFFSFEFLFFFSFSDDEEAHDIAVT